MGETNTAHTRMPATGPKKPEVSTTVVSDDDELLVLDEVCEVTRRTEATERWLRHTGKTDYLWRNGRILVAWRSEVLAHLAAAREADRASRGGAR